MLDYRKQYDLVVRKKAELEERMSSPELAGNPKEMTQASRAYRRNERLLEALEKRASAEKRLEEAREMLREGDPEMQELARLEIEECEPALAETERQLQLVLLPPDPTDEKNTSLEIRAGTGGDEAALFAADLARMYQRFCEAKNWKMDLISATPTELGGFKEAVFSIEGEAVYIQMKFES